MAPQLSAIVALVTIALTSSAVAQTSFPEIEPNSQKSEATVVSGIVAGDSITGLSTGTGTTLGSSIDTTADVFRVKTGVLLLGIYKHTLTLTTSTAAGHTGTIRGLLQSTGVIGTTDVTFQTSLTTTSPPRANHWFGFGKQEEIYYRVTGASATTALYNATLTTTPVTATIVGTAFTAGMLTVTSVGQTTTDTEIFVYDANFNALPGYHNDDTMPAGTLQSRLVRSFIPGTYYIAVGDYNAATNLSDANADENSLSGQVLDFPHAICARDVELGPVDCDITISDGGAPVPVTLLTNGIFDIAWARFTVNPSSTPSTSFCTGNAVGTTCLGCGNNGAAGRGCANSSFAAGALLANSGFASIGSDTLTLTASSVTGPGLFFQANALAAIPITFGDGMLCAAGGIIRLAVVFPTGGSASHPSPFAPNPISVGGAPISAGDTKHYQFWYRDSAAFCTSDTFNLTNGISLTWTS